MQELGPIWPLKFRSPGFQSTLSCERALCSGVAFCTTGTQAQSNFQYRSVVIGVLCERGTVSITFPSPVDRFIEKRRTTSVPLSGLFL